MVVAEEYRLKYDAERAGYIVLCWQRHACPACGAPLSGYDLRRRQAVDLEGATRSYYLRRLRCAGCGKLHTEIPAFMLPYKHYTRAAIAEGMRGGPTCCPADNSTIRRWRK
jgi:hypothetical protein